MNEITNEIKTKAWVGGSFHKIRYTYCCTIVPSVFIRTIAPWSTKQNWKTRRPCKWLLSLGRECSGCYKGKKLNNYDEAKNIAVCFDLVPKRVCVPSNNQCQNHRYFNSFANYIKRCERILEMSETSFREYVPRIFILSSEAWPLHSLTGMQVLELKDSHPSIILPSWRYVFYFTLTEDVWANKPVNS